MSLKFRRACIFGLLLFNCGLCYPTCLMETIAGEYATHITAIEVNGQKLTTVTVFCFQAALIMQVLQLSDDQIAMLPDDQRQSIMILKEQLARSSN